MALFHLPYFVIEIVSVRLNLLEGALSVEVVGLKVSLPDLIEFAFKVLTLFFVALELDLELEAPLLGLSDKRFTLRRLCLHLVDLVGLEIVLDFVLRESRLKLLDLGPKLLYSGLFCSFSLGYLCVTVLLHLLQIGLRGLHIPLVGADKYLLLL